MMNSVNPIMETIKEEEENVPESFRDSKVQMHSSLRGVSHSQHTIGQNQGYQAQSSPQNPVKRIQQSLSNTPGLTNLSTNNSTRQSIQGGSLQVNQQYNPLSSGFTNQHNSMISSPGQNSMLQTGASVGLVNQGSNFNQRGNVQGLS